MRYKLFILIFCSIAFFTRCADDVVKPRELVCKDDIASIVYEGEVKRILDTKCASSGCHDGSGRVINGDYITYQALQGIINNGLFKERVFDLENMPDPNQVSDLELLTDDELNLLHCWAENNYKEN